MKILVTGARGQLGMSLQDSKGPDIVAFAREDLDIASLASVRAAVEQVGPDVIVNAAAYNQVDAAEQDGTPAFLGNAVGPRNLAVAAEATDCPLVHVSTDYVFDGMGTRPYHEYDATGPRSVYGASKLAGEDAVRSLCRKHYIVRTAWVYHNDGNNFPNTIRRLAERGEVRVVSDQVGCPTFAPHLAAGILELIETEAYGTYHLAGGGEASWYELTRSLFEALGIEAAVRPVASDEFPRPAPRPAYSVLTSIQDPAIRLPAWEEGLAEFARRARTAG